MGDASKLVSIAEDICSKHHSPLSKEAVTAIGVLGVLGPQKIKKLKEISINLLGLDEAYDEMAEIKKSLESLGASEAAARTEYRIQALDAFITGGCGGVEALSKGQKGV